MNFLKDNFNYELSYSLKIFILILFVTFILYNITKLTETFIDEEPFKIIFDDISDPLILKEGTYSLNGESKIPPIIFQRLNNIVSFNIASNYYALISLNNTPPNVFRGDHTVQNNNIFKNVTSIQVLKNY